MFEAFGGLGQSGTIPDMSSSATAESRINNTFSTGTMIMPGGGGGGLWPIAILAGIAAAIWYFKRG